MLFDSVCVDDFVLVYDVVCFNLVVVDLGWLLEVGCNDLVGVILVVLVCDIFKWVGDDGGIDVIELWVCLWCVLIL